MNPKKLSVIIPVYNVELYLNQCLDSIVNQSLKEIEIICVNDGSTDNSINLLNEYAAKDNRVIIIDKKNEGVGVASNLGIEKASGEYLAFVGSDDWIDVNMYETMYTLAKKYRADVTICEHELFNDQSGEILQPLSYQIPIPEKLENAPFHWTNIPDTLFLINSGPCNKIYKTEFVKNIEAKYAIGLYYQDILFVFKCLLHAKVLTFIRKPFYIIRHLRPGSITTDKGKRQFDIFEVMRLFEKEIQLIPDAELLKSKFAEYKITQFIYHFNKVDSSFKKEFLDRMQSELNPNNEKRKSSGRFKLLILIYKIRLLENLKTISFKVLGKHTFKFLKQYRAVQAKMIK